MDKVMLIAGQTIQVALIGEGSVEGELKYVSYDSAYIQLSNVRDLATNRLLGIQFYYSSEIRSIQILQEAPDSSLSNVQPQPALSTKQHPKDVLDSALKKIDECVFIYQTDYGYLDAIADLRDQPTFGVFMECIEDERHIKFPSLLSFVTCDRIYIFDMKSVKMTIDIRDLLSSDSYIRVIHNGRIMKNVLQYSYGLVLGRCFDIKVALIVIDKAEGKVDEDSAINSENSIQYCVEKYLKVPEKFFDEDVDYDERPLENESKLAAAKNVAFLLDLQDHIVHEILLERLYASCEMYANSLAQMKRCTDKSIKKRITEMEELRKISPFSLAMDVELFKNQTN